MITNSVHTKVLNRGLKQIFKSDFDNVYILKNKIRKTSYSKIDISTNMFGMKMSLPLYINSFKGDGSEIRKINSELDYISKKTGLILVTDINNLVYDNLSLEKDYKINLQNNIQYRKNDTNKYIANMGKGYEVKLLFNEKNIKNFKALQLEIDSLREIIIPERITSISPRLISLKKLIKGLNYHILVKEVGDFIKKENLKKLSSVGVKTIDISGYGGNNVDRSVSFQLESKNYIYLENYGQSAVLSLLEAKDHIEDMEILVSSGIRNPLDILKSLAMGARAVGITQPILNSIRNYGLNTTIIILNKWIEQIKLEMYYLSVKNIEDLRQTDIIIDGRVKQYALCRNIDYEYYSKRSR